MTKLLKRKLIIIVAIIIIIFILINVFDIPIKILKTIYPKTYKEEVIKYSKEYNVDDNLIFAIIKAESNFNKNAVSNKGAKGLMQLMENTAKDVAVKIQSDVKQDEISQNLLDDDFNIQLGTKYISILIEKYQNIEIALTAYNAGSGTVDNWIEKGILNKDGSNIEKIPYKETNNYVRKILRDYKIYSKIY